MLPLAEVKLNARALQNVELCVKSGWISSQGSFVPEFEKVFAEYVDCKYAIAVSNGTAALHLALASLGVGKGDEVLVPSFTFIATANAVTYTGAKPVFCDVDPKTWCIDVDDAELHISKNTKAIIPVHLNGHPAAMTRLFTLAMKRRLYVIEDACQALGTTHEHHQVGSMGHVGCFSFFANKLLTTGEGGMCTTNSEALANIIRTLRDHGRANKHAYVHDFIGYNYRMTNLQAGVGISQVPELEGKIEVRLALYHRYLDTFSPGVCQEFVSGQVPWLMHARHENAPQGIRNLQTIGVESRPFYTPCHLQRPYRGDTVSLPVSESLEGVMLPLHEGVTDSDMRRMRECLG